MKRIVRYMIIGLFAALLVLAAAAWWLLGTNSGARWALDQVARFTAMTMKTESVEGRLWGELRIEGLHIAWPEGAADIREFKLNWQPLFLPGRISVSELYVAGVLIQDNRPETPAPPGLNWPAKSGIPPLPVRIRSLVLNDITYQRLEQPPVRINHAEADVRLSPGLVSLRNMTFKMPQVQIKGMVTVGLGRPRLLMDAAIIPAARAAGMDEFRVKTELLPAEAPAELQGTVQMAGFSGSKKLAELDARLIVTNRALLIESVKMSQPGRRGYLSGQGEWMFAGESPAFDGKLVLNDLDLSKEVPFLSNVGGTITIKGSTREYEGALSAVNKGTGWKAGRLEAAFRGTSGSLALTSLKGNWLEGTIRGTARLERKEPLSVTASLNVRGVNPGAIAPDWSGTINMNVNAAASLPQKKQPRGTVSLRLLKSRLRGERLTGDVEAGLKQGSIRLDRLVLHGRGFDVEASGDLAERIGFSIRLPDLSLLRQDAEGRAAMQGWIRKRGKNLSGSLTARGSRLALNGVKAASINLSGRIEDREDIPFSLKLSVQDGTFNFVRVDSLAVGASGTATDHTIRISLQSSISSIIAKLNGAYRNGAWQGTIVQLSGSDATGSWNARESASLVISIDRFSLSPLVLSGPGDERIDVQGTVERSPLAGSFSVEWRQLNISRANAWLTGASLSGFTTGRIYGKVLPEGSLDVVADASLSRGSITSGLQDLELKAELKKADLSLVWRGQTMEGKLSLVFAEYGQIDARLEAPLPARLPVSPIRDGPLRASISGQVREAGALSFLFPGLIQESRGQVDLNIAVGGTWGDPGLKGSLTLDKAGAYFPAAGIRVTDIQLNALIERNTVRIDSLKGRSGPGRIEGKATVALDGWRPVRYEGSLQGERFQALLLPQMRMLVSPAIEFKGTPGKISARGEIKIPELLVYGPPREEAVPPSEDVVIVGAREEEVSERMSMDIEIKIILGDRVIVKAEGVDAQLGGETLLTIRSLREVTGKGEVKVTRGKYSIYGVSLDIKRGRLFFAGGPIENPTLDILALRTVNDVQAGVLVTGTLQKPAVKLYSEPAMPDADVLAYIVLGHPLGQDKEQASLLMKAAGALLSAGQSVALQDQIKNRLSIDAIDIETGGGEVSRSLVTIGKYLSSRLYISYGYALFTGESLFRMRYRFAKHWEVESHSGETSGVDLYYTIQFD